MKSAVLQLPIFLLIYRKFRKTQCRKIKNAPLALRPQAVFLSEAFLFSDKNDNSVLNNQINML